MTTDHVRRASGIAGAFVAILSTSVSAAPLVPERVMFDSLDRDRATGAPVRIAALLFRPEGPGDAKFPAVVAFHGCGGMYSTQKARHDDLSIRHQMMAELLVGEGYVVLFPDSFRVRGQSEICSIENRKRTITQTNRRLDAQGALAFLQARADVARDRIDVLGWSHGGSTVLAALNARQESVAAWRKRGPGVPYFRAGVAFYPGCIESLQGKDGYAAVAPLTLFVGGSDDWTAPGPCIDFAKKLAGADPPVAIFIYADTYHGFDGPASQKRLRLEVPNGVNPGKGVTVASNPLARDDAYARLKAFLRRELGLSQRDARQQEPNTSPAN